MSLILTTKQCLMQKYKFVWFPPWEHALLREIYFFNLSTWMYNITKTRPLVCKLEWFRSGRDWRVICPDSNRALLDRESGFRTAGLQNRPGHDMKDDLHLHHEDSYRKSGKMCLWYMAVLFLFWAVTSCRPVLYVMREKVHCCQKEYSLKQKTPVLGPILNYLFQQHGPSNTRQMRFNSYVFEQCLWGITP